MAHFLSYWKPRTVRYTLDQGFFLLEHSASDQYDRVSVGDTVWIATVWPGGHLCVLGPIRVGVVTDDAGVARHFGTEEFWQAEHHIISAEDTAVGIREVDASDLAPQLRFLSKNDRLKVEEGRINPQQLQSLRELTPESAQILEDRWAQQERAEQTAADAVSGFGDPEHNRLVEASAIDVVTTIYKRQGWKVTSVERDNVGYDLLCTRGDHIERVEVKGTSSSAPAFRRSCTRHPLKS